MKQNHLTSAIIKQLGFHFIEDTLQQDKNLKIKHHTCEYEFACYIIEDSIIITALIIPASFDQAREVETEWCIQHFAKHITSIPELKDLCRNLEIQS